MHYAGIALVTDYDTGVEHDPAVAAVTQDHVFEFFEANLHRMRALLLDLIPQLPDDPSGCECRGCDRAAFTVRNRLIPLSPDDHHR